MLIGQGGPTLGMREGTVLFTRENAPGILLGIGFEARHNVPSETLLFHSQDAPFAMNDEPLSLSEEARQHRPYRSLYAALLFQSFQDALDEAMPEDASSDRDEVAFQERRAVPAGQSMLVSRA